MLEYGMISLFYLKNFNGEGTPKSHLFPCTNHSGFDLDIEALLYKSSMIASDNDDDDDVRMINLATLKLTL